MEKTISFILVSHTAHKQLIHIPQSLFFCFMKSFFFLLTNKENNIHVNLEVLVK